MYQFLADSVDGAISLAFIQPQRMGIITDPNVSKKLVVGCAGNSKSQYVKYVKL